MKFLDAFSLRFSFFNRRRKLSWIEKLIQDRQIGSCLLVGAKPNLGEYAFDNLIESGIAKVVPQVTVSGLEQESSFWPNWVQADGMNLPFADFSFDLVFSNAVIEHVGDEPSQRRYISEHTRVGKNWIFTTPNRLFPVESHTRILFRHMSRKWTHPDVSRLLSKRDLKEMLPKGSTIKGNLFSPTLLCYGPVDKVTK